MIFEGRVRKVGDDMSATDIVPARYDLLGMSKRWDECAKHLFEDIDPGMSSGIEPGDLLVAGRNLGAGHAHYYMTAIRGSAAGGFAALFADSLGALFLRAAIDAGVPAWPLPGISDLVSTDDRLRIDLAGGEATNLTTKQHKRFEPVSDIVLDILAAGGSDRWAIRRVQQREQSPA